MVVPGWFYLLGGASLVLLGVLQLLSRPQSASEKNALMRWLSAGVLWSLVCVVVGTLLVLYGAGWLRVPGLNPTEKPHQRLKH